MDVFEAIANRRSIKRFTRRPVRRPEIERVLEAAVRAPNHRLTEPWSFLVLGERTRRFFAELRAGGRAARVKENEAAEAVREKVFTETMEVPAIIAVTCFLAEDPVVRAEDYAATFMAIEHMALAAVALGLGTYIRTGEMLERAELRAELGVSRDHRIVAFVYLGEPAELPAERPRKPASEKTRWLD